MSTDYEALAEYLERRLDKRFDSIGTQLNDLKNDTLSIKRSLYRLIDHVDMKNDGYDEEIKNHETRISTLESDFRVLTS